MYASRDVVHDLQNLVADNILPSVVHCCFELSQLVSQGCQLLLMDPALLAALPQLSLMMPALTLNSIASNLR